MSIRKYFKKPAVIMNKDRWKYNLADMIKSAFYATLTVAIGAVTVTMFLYALLSQDY